MSEACQVSAPATPIDITALETAMLQSEQVPCAVSHHFGPGLYIREVSMPSGTLAIGHHQKREHLNVMLKGRVLMLRDDGSVLELCAPQVFIGSPGRKVGYVLEDIVWQNIYATEERDIDILESLFIEKSDAWKYNATQKMAMESLKHAGDREDYRAVLLETGFSHETAVTQSENEEDQTEFPNGYWRVRVQESPIQGMGLFSTYPINAGEIIAPARIGGLRTPAGRFTNHSKTPNAIMVRKEDGDIDLVAAKRIEGCCGGDAGEEITIDYRQALRLSLGEIK